MSFFSSLTTLAFFSLPENGFCLALSAVLPAQQSCLMDFPAPQRLNTQKSYGETDREVIHVLLKLFFFVCAANVYLLTESSEDLPKGSRADEIVWEVRSLVEEYCMWMWFETTHDKPVCVCRVCRCVCEDPLPWSFWRTCRLKQKSLNACSIKMEIQCYGIIQIVQNMPNNITLALYCNKVAIIKGIVHPKMNIVIIYSRVISKLGGLCSSVKHKRRYFEECCGLSLWLSLFLAIDILLSANCSKILLYCFYSIFNQTL